MHGYGREKGEENTESKKKKVFEVLIRHNRDCFVENRSKNKKTVSKILKKSAKILKIKPILSLAG